MIRLFLETQLVPDQTISLSHHQAHYLEHVMRLGAGEELEVFNESEGSFCAVLLPKHKNKTLSIIVKRRCQPPEAAATIELAFSPLKKVPSFFLITKAVEVGVGHLQPLKCKRTTSHASTKYKEWAIEACEQSGRTRLPSLGPTLSLDAWMAQRDFRKPGELLWCALSDDLADDFVRDATKGGIAQEGGALSFLRTLSQVPRAILVGPEGGFSPQERERLLHHNGTLPLTLGPYTLRAETASCAALTLYHCVFS